MRVCVQVSSERMPKQQSHPGVGPGDRQRTQGIYHAPTEGGLQTHAQEMMSEKVGS